MTKAMYSAEERHWRQGKGLRELTPAQRQRYGHVGGTAAAAAPDAAERAIERGHIGGARAKELHRGIHGRTHQQMVKDGAAGGTKALRLGRGIHGLLSYGPHVRWHVNRGMAPRRPCLYCEIGIEEALQAVRTGRIPKEFKKRLARAVSRGESLYARARRGQ